MAIPKLYTILPKKEDESPDLEVLTSHSSEIVTGDDGEKFVVLSYFPETLKYSELNNFVLNKYVLFVLNENEATDYSIEWHYDLEDSEGSVLGRFAQEEIPVSSQFEYAFGLKDLTYPEASDWELTLKIECHISKDGEAAEIVELQHSIVPIEADLLSQNGASFEDESGLDNSSVYLGNEGTTHFMRGHLSEYLVAKKKSLNPNGTKSPNNAADFVNQAAAIAYNKVLSVADSISPDETMMVPGVNYNNLFNSIFSNQNLEGSILADGPFNSIEFWDLGICSLNLHHVLPIILGIEPERADTTENLIGEIKSAYDLYYDDYIEAYHRCVFPKSAIGLAVDIFDKLFKAFKADAGHNFQIYETFETKTADKNAKIDDWKALNYSELRENSNDKFMKNLIAEYYFGFYEAVSPLALSVSSPEKVLKIDWSQFIQKLLNPTTVTVPFTLIKIQVNDLRSGKPIENALIEKLEFHSFEDEPNYAMDRRFTYEIKKPHDTKLIVKPTDSKNKRVQKICKAMGYYTGGLDNGYGNGMRTAIFKYMSSSDRTLPIPIDAPESAAAEHVDPKKEAWIDYILEDFEANCMTDGDGILNCRVPDQLLDGRKLNINVGFAHFAVVREIFDLEDRTMMDEKAIKRPISLDGSPTTHFHAHWVGDTGLLPVINPNEQNLNWEENLTGDGNFGWKITETYNELTPEQKLSTKNQLRLAIPLVVKKSKTEDYNKYKIKFSEYLDYGLTIDDYNHFSTFYSETGIHFVLYGMQWCQSVWDEYDYLEKVQEEPEHPYVEDVEVNLNPKNSYVQDENFLHPHMHLVTHPLEMGGTFKYGGKGYAKFENTYTLTGAVWRSGNGHRGYDIHVLKGASVFAFHYGKIYNSLNAGDLGKYTKITWTKHDESRTDEHTAISYGHLDSLAKSTNDYVKAGEVVATGGRTGNLGEVSWNPTHVHINVGTENTVARKYYPKLRKTLDDYFPENATMLPNNFSPLLFPCRTEITKAKWNPASCKLDGKDFVHQCWAAAELRCPYIDKSMNKASEKPFQLQTQLNHLNEKPENVTTNDLNVKYKIKSEESTSFPDYHVDTSGFLEKDKNEKYFSPGVVDGEIGDTITKIDDSELAVGTSLTILTDSVYSNTNYKLKRVQYEESPGVNKITWIEQSFIDAGNNITDEIKNVPSNKPSRTKMAVYAFRAEHELLKMDDYYLNFETDDEFWSALNDACNF